MKLAAKFPLAPSAATLTSKLAKSPLQPLLKPSEWKLTERAKDLFTTRIFRRIEVDEMLPESTLQEIRMSRACKAHCRTPSTETVSTTSEMTDGSDTPVEPSPILPRPDASPTRMAPAAHVRSGSLTTVREVNSLSFSFPLDRAQTAPIVPQNDATREDKIVGTGAAAAELEDEGTLPIMMLEPKSVAAVFPSSSPSAAPMPTIKNVHRRLPSRKLPPLPTIPEMIAPENSILPTSVTQPPWSPSAKKTINPDDYIILPSMPFSVTMPTFRQGPIRLAKADLSIGKLAAAVDYTLDWTAFQMTILGGAGDFVGEPTDYSRLSDAELDERDDIFAWFSGFDGPGPLLISSSSCDETQRTPSLSPSRNRNRKPKSPASLLPSSRASSADSSSSPRTVCDAVGPDINRTPIMSSDLPIPVELDHQHQPRQQRQQQQHHRSVSSDLNATAIATVPSSRFSRYRNSNTNNNNIPGNNYNNSNHRNHVGLAIDATRRPSLDSVNSLPQSPMLDLVVCRDVDGNEYVVPMGFNLGHDLRDFLKWEAENVFGYYGPDSV